MGFRGASLSEILNKLGVSKGALYHHFPDKLSLGYAVLEECFGMKLMRKWQQAFECGDPITGTINMLDQQASMDCKDTLCCGCPINNLATEMSPVDEGFRERIETIYDKWHQQIAGAFAVAQANGTVSKRQDPVEIAYFIIATIQGAIGLAKNAQCNDVFGDAVKGLTIYLESMRQRAA